jgi:signal transduction histidine kinase
MFTEKNISKIIIITPVVAVILVAILTIFSFIKTQNNYFEDESQRMEKEFLKTKKRLLKKEIESISNYVAHQERIFMNQEIEKIIKTTHFLSSLVGKLYADLNLEVNKEKQLEIVTNLINSTFVSKSYFFVYDVKNNRIIQPDNKDIVQEFKEDDKDFENYLFSEKGKLITFDASNKVVYMKHIPELNWMVGNIENVEEEINFIKKETLKYVSSVRFDKNGYIWVYDTNYKLKSDPFLQERTMHDTMFVQDAVNKAKENEKLSFIEYSLDETKEKYFSKKFAYVKYFEKWDWVIGTSLYTDDFEKSIEKNKKLLEIKSSKHIENIILISFFIVLVIGLLSMYISKKISQTIIEYQKKEKYQQKLLKHLNIDLEKKVKLGIDEAQAKDRAMLHQSRLARMGTMLSMIAHQWRQPLTEISSINMDLETAIKFQKSDDAFVLECIKENDKLIEYMSNTIDDFRNYFKPNKEKMEFSIVEACEKSLDIIEATLKHLNITINKNFKDDVIINGYEREFSQVILNMFINSKDALIHEHRKNAFINISVTSKNKRTLIKVEDNAGGIEIENMDKIFEPYFSTKNKQEGTGLGLYMSKMIIEKNMNGTLTVTNGEQGAIFEINLSQ